MILDRTATVRDPAETVAGGLVTDAPVTVAAGLPCAVSPRSSRQGGSSRLVPGGPYGPDATGIIDADIHTATFEAVPGWEFEVDDGRRYEVVAPALVRVGRTIRHVSHPVRRVRP